ncbi:hypothetical protein MNBD_ALPHA04-1242 [hydrothermal vent metagenome]|uniref:Uncharacterized protein n=1 Tax=hydrothermal vent metagenome TaxID=652676 RepID=A0A3B0RWV4_9ZZZZ
MKYIICTALLLSSCATARTPGPWVDNFNQQRKPAIPADVRSFIIKRQGCDHFRGEPGYDAERQKFLTEQIDKLCTGTDNELSKLLHKYAGSRVVGETLSEFEQCIESYQGRDCPTVAWTE